MNSRRLIRCPGLKLTVYYERTKSDVRLTSALPLITDLERTLRHVGYGPNADIGTATRRKPSKKGPPSHRKTY